MKKNSKIILVLIIVMLSMSLAGTVALADGRLSAEDIEFLPEYTYGSEVEIPDAIIKVDGINYDAVAIVRTPSGKSLRVSKLRLNESGVYSVVYSANLPSGLTESVTHSFISAGKLYQVDDQKSEVSFGRYLYGQYEINRDAIKLSLGRDDTFKYNEIIDLNDIARNQDGSMDSFLDFFVAPSQIGTYEAENITVTLVDAYDPSNFVTYTLRGGQAKSSDWAIKTTYVMGHTQGQIATGLERRAGEKFIIESGKHQGVYKLHNINTSAWGAGVTFSMSGNPNFKSVSDPQNNPQDVGSQTMRLALDMDEKTLYANTRMVTILDDPAIYDKQSLWGGFTTGEVYLSIAASTFNAERLNLAITKIGTKTASGGALTINRFVDNKGPDINIDYDGINSDNIPSAVVGLPYKVFGAEAFDLYDGVCEVKTAVYYDYMGADQVEINIKDGAFVPRAEGTYVIVYLTQDNSGNKAQIVIPVDAIANDTEALSIDIKMTGPLTGKVGQLYTIAEPEFANARGELRWSAAAVLRSDQSIKHSVSKDTLTFRPEYTGVYDIVYSYGDYVYEKELKLEFNSTASNKPVITLAPSFPKYIIRGSIVELDNAEGYVYSSGAPQRKDVNIYVIEDSKPERKLDGLKLVTYAKETIQIIYRIENNGETDEIVSAVYPVIDVGYGADYKLQNYFYGEAFEADAQRDYIRYTTNPAKNGGAANAEMEFVKSLQVFDFSAKFAAAKLGFDKISIVLTDTKNPSVALKFTYMQKNQRVFFGVNLKDGEEPEILLEGVSFTDTNNPMFLAFSNQIKRVYPLGTANVYQTISKDINGKDFDGFYMSRANMKILLEDVTGEAAINITNISGQNFTWSHLDSARPRLSAVADSGEKVFDSVYTLEPVYMGDVLDPNAYYYMSVTAPDGTYVKALDGTVLDKGADPAKEYKFRLNQYGNFTVNYAAQDNSNTPITYTYLLKVVDLEPPQLRLVDPVTTGKAGEVIKISRLRITDNFYKNAEDFTVVVSVITPAYREHTLTHGELHDETWSYSSGIIAEAGIYTINYMVLDGNNNIAYASYKITVV